MPFINPIPLADSDEGVRSMYARQQAHYGYIPAYAKVFCYRPEVMRLWAQLQSGIKKHVDVRRYELATFAAATALRSSLCSLAHGKVLTQFISPEDVAAIARGEAPQSLTPAETAIVELARRVANDATSVTNGDVEQLRQHGLHDAEIFDIVAIAAARSFWTKIIDSLGSDADEPSRAIDKEFRSAMTVGRPLNFVEPDRLPQE